MSTRLLISPGYRWRWTDGLLTNFHLPKSTLLALVSSLFEGGVPDLLGVYAEAIRERYRFFSYGDAMIILP
jgi:S-adenosylmethionine:tRNA ribosyltransferase-isomerase